VKARCVEEFYRFRWLAWLRATSEALREFELCYEDVLVMSAIAHLGRLSLFPKQEQVAREVCLDSVSIARRVARLERRGLLLRRAAVWDRRARAVALTRAGRTMLATCEARFVALRRAVFFSNDTPEFDDRGVVTNVIISRRPEKRRRRRFVTVRSKFDWDTFGVLTVPEKPEVCVAPARRRILIRLGRMII
jgi:DNA-binding MarR family transcriptional regulator